MIYTSYTTNAVLRDLDPAETAGLVEQGIAQIQAAGADLVFENTTEGNVGANFAFVNQRLATHYAYPNAATLTANFQKVPVTDAKRQGGVLTQANFLTVTSQRDRTSPTRRDRRRAARARFQGHPHRRPS